MKRHRMRSMDGYSGLLCFLFIVGAQAAGGVEESNEYMDNLLSETFPRFSGILHEAPLIDFKIKLNRMPVLPAPDFLVRTNSYRDTSTVSAAQRAQQLNVGRQLAMSDARRSFASHWNVKRSVGPNEGVEDSADLEMDLRHSRITNFSKMRRLGNCSPPLSLLDNITLSCFLALDGIKAHYLGYIKEEYAVTDISATLKNSTSFIEVTSLPGREPTLSAWVVFPFELEMAYSRNLNIATGLRIRLQSEIHRRIKTYVNMFLNKELKDGFESAVKFDPLPPV